MIPGSMNEIFELLKSRTFPVHRRHRRSGDAKKRSPPTMVISGCGAKITRKRTSRTGQVCQRTESIGKTLFVYFKHEESGIGPKLAKQMIELVE